MASVVLAGDLRPVFNRILGPERSFPSEELGLILRVGVTMIMSVLLVGHTSKLNLQGVTLVGASVRLSAGLGPELAMTCLSQQITMAYLL